MSIDKGFDQIPICNTKEGSREYGVGVISERGDFLAVYVNLGDQGRQNFGNSCVSASISHEDGSVKIGPLMMVYLWFWNIGCNFCPS